MTNIRTAGDMQFIKPELKSILRSDLLAKMAMPIMKDFLLLESSLPIRTGFVAEVEPE